MSQRIENNIKNAADFANAGDLGLIIDCNCGGQVTFRTDNVNGTPAGNWWLLFVAAAQAPAQEVKPHVNFCIKVAPSIPFTLQSDKHLPEGKFRIIHDDPNNANAGYLHVFMTLDEA